MQIRADAYSKFTHKTHTVISETDEVRSINGNKDGTVNFSMVARGLSLSGDYTLRFKLSKKEIQRFAKESEIGYLRSQIKELKAELAKYSKK